MSAGILLSELTGEIALFAAVGGLLFALDDLVVDLIYFVRLGWRSLTIYSRYPRAFADALAPPDRLGRIAVLIPAWDEAAVIGDMLRATLAFEHDDYRLYVGHYRNDPATALAIGEVADPRVRRRADGRRSDDQGRLPQPSLSCARRRRSGRHYVANAPSGDGQ